MKVISWILIVIGFIFAGTFNFASFKGTYWEETSEQSYELAEHTYVYNIGYEISDIGKVFDVELYEPGSIIKVINNDKIFYYNAYKIKPINLDKWQDPVFWAQVAINTIYVSSVYAIFLINKQEDLINELGNEKLDEKGNVIGYELNPIELQYKKLFDSEEKVIPKKADFERYLTLVVNEDIDTEMYIEKLKIRKKRIYTWRLPITIFTLGILKPKKMIKRIYQDINDAKKYRMSLHELEKQAKIYMEIPSKHKETTYDTVYDRIDLSTSQTVKIGYSRERATRVLIAKSPLTVFVSLFTAILVFGNISITWGEWTTVLALMLTLSFSTGMKIRSAIKHAKNVVANLLKSLEKTNQMIATFLLLNETQLSALKSLNEVEQPQKDEKQETSSAFTPEIEDEQPSLNIDTSYRPMYE